MNMWDGIYCLGNKEVPEFKFIVSDKVRLDFSVTNKEMRELQEINC